MKNMQNVQKMQNVQNMVRLAEYAEYEEYAEYTWIHPSIQASIHASMDPSRFKGHGIGLKSPYFSTFPPQHWEAKCFAEYVEYAEYGETCRI